MGALTRLYLIPPPPAGSITGQNPINHHRCFMFGLPKSVRTFAALLSLLVVICIPALAQQAVPPSTTVTAVTTQPAVAPAAPPASTGTTTINVPASAGPTAVVIPQATATATPDWLNALAIVGIALVMGLVGFGLNIVNKKAGLENNANALAIEARARDALHSALESLAGRAIVELGPKINTAVMNIQNPTIRAIAQAAPGLAGDAIKFFGLSPDTIAQKIIDKIGVLTAANPSANPTSSQPPAA